MSEQCHNNVTTMSEQLSRGSVFQTSVPPESTLNGDVRTDPHADWF